METGEAPQSHGMRRRARIEVFSAVLECEHSPSDEKYGLKGKFGYTGVFGVLLLRSCDRNYPIFDSTIVEPRQINSQGHLHLTGPKCSIPVEDEIFILPWFANFLVYCMDQSRHVLWKADEDNMDRLICKIIKCFLNINMHVSFAVYHDAVEAHLDVYFMDLEYGEEDALIQVDGNVTASNSLLCDSKAESILFHKLSGESVSLKAGNSVPLTLSRRMTVIPHRSTLSVHVDLQVCMGHGHPLPFKGTLEFNPGPDYAEQFIIPPNRGGKLLVKVTWVECEDRLE